MKKLLTVGLILTISLAAWAGVGVINSSGAYLGSAAYLKCSTGVTCTMSGNQVTAVSSPSLVGPLTLENGVVLSNPSSSDVTVFASSLDSSLSIKAGEAKGAILNLYADEGDDAADKFSIQASADGTMKIFASDTVESLSVSATSGDITTAGALKVEGAFGIGTGATFASGDATPSVSYGSFFKTFVNDDAVVITDFDGALFEGKEITVISQGTATYDVTGSGILCGTTDVVTASGDVTKFIYDGADWYCTSRVDASDDLN